MRQQSATWLAAGVAAVGLAVGCNREAPTPNADVPPDSRPAAQTEALTKDVEDAWITTKIESKFFLDQDVKARNVDVSTSDGVVTLTGSVDNDRAREQAVAIAKATDGVVRVEDRLSANVAATTGATPGAAPTAGSERSTLPHQRIGDPVGNAWITSKIQAKYFADPTVKARLIDVTTNNGVVTLTGTVNSTEEKDKALSLARDTDGVRRVEDRLQLMTGDAAAATTGETASMQRDRGVAEQMSDAGITMRVQSKFFLDDAVKARNINVNTTGGVVTLQGQVSNELEQQQAIALARSVDGVQDVKSELQVSAAAAPSSRPAGAGAAVEDTWITTKIQSKYFVDDVVKGSRIDVTTNGGVVTLAGQVQSREARQRAEALARQTDGVKRVDNKLAIGTETTTTSASPPPQ